MAVTLDLLQRTALLSALLVKKSYLEERLREIEEELSALEKEYGNYENFEKQVKNNFEEHEIWINWSFLLEAKKRIEEELRAIDDLT